MCSEATSVGPTRKGRSLKDEAKPFGISRWEVWDAYLKVKSNQGAAGLDRQSIEEFEKDMKNNLYVASPPCSCCGADSAGFSP
jgi:hypothetical protein